MKRAARIIVPIILILTILLGSLWYLFIYDRAFTRDVLLGAARLLDKNGQETLATWFYDRAYEQADNGDEIAIELADQFINEGNYTQAERILQKAIYRQPTLSLYTKLSNVFIAQDKVLDAVQLLDNIKAPEILKELESKRPAAPTTSFKDGLYNQYIDVDIQGNGGKLYANAHKQYPSVESDLYTDPIRLPAGESHIYAVVINEDGLVSPLSIFAYTIMDVIERIDFQDPVVEAAIREALKADSDEVIYSDDLWTIEELTLPEGVTTFADLPHLRSLKKLSVKDGPDGEVSLLSNLKQLQTLSITNIAISRNELEVIGSFSGLTSLTLSHCSLATTLGLEKLEALKYLDLSNNTIRNLEGLSDKKNLTTLNLQRNSVIDLQDISGCSNLETLNVSFNAITSLAPIQDLQNLQSLHADNNAIAALDFTEKMPTVRILSLERNALTDISGILTFENLEDLNISGNTITDISALASITSLKALDFSVNSVSALPSFSKDCALISIDGSGNSISSIKPLAGLENINVVIMDGNENLASVDDLAT